MGDETHDDLFSFIVELIKATVRCNLICQLHFCDVFQDNLKLLGVNRQLNNIETKLLQLQPLDC